ncbi:hypothetical protein EV198_0562 [Roseivirga ehrenbergii]|uniref:DUF3324 domain-containing protein n=1 Tax=Roseivirga ehrenbergii (strain DSM 102268 / JCM 13514 / KCTC 12282 / NCIMB 14502 / KMM 6017) TaxID=279360 RepID=A0A150X868_ROSEK|nr:hypothetical protein [Roseivirga ehrenbergii]KYG74927.1 hypothetical protein MB14_06915 [Roseivirga ehrenbergii]TCL13732.1 hypothetical protein EV198_0562 [Roseivirga ehrenbergii]
MKKIFLTLVLIASLASSAFASVTIINGLTHMYNGNSGDVIVGEIVLINGSDIEQRVKFSINEAIFSCGANRVFTEMNPHLQSSSGWIDSGVTERLLLPRERYVHKFKITIPKDQGLKGSFWSVMMVYVERPIKEEMLNNSIGLNTKIRYAVGLLTNVNGFDEPNLDFEQVQLDEKTGKRALGIKMKNDGAFIEGVKLSLEVYDSKGNKVKVLETDRNLVFPGVCKDYIIDISDLPEGEYQCLLLAEARKEYVGTNISLTQK